MTQVPITWLAEVLREAGCTVKTYKGWKTRGRPPTSGGFDPTGVLVHHTGTKTSLSNPAPTVGTCIKGRPAQFPGDPNELPGPLCHLVLGFDGVFHVIAAGRANHAGTAKASGPMPAGDGNAMYVGIEVDYSGSQDMGAAQMDALLKGSAAILKHLRRNENFLRGHKETSSAGKWDPGRKGSSSPEYLMGPIRGKVGNLLNPPQVRFVLMDGEGNELAHSAPTRVGWKPELERLEAFDDTSRARRLRELRDDADVAVRRVKA